MSKKHYELIGVGKVIINTSLEHVSIYASKNGHAQFKELPGEISSDKANEVITKYQFRQLTNKTNEKTNYYPRDTPGDIGMQS
jgi:hypothetical protein